MKKVVMSGILALLCLAVILAGCSSNTNSSNNAANQPAGSDNGTGESANVATAAGEFPIVKEKTTLKVMVMGDANVESFDDNEFTKWYEEKTNVHVEWEVVPPMNAQDKLNLTLAGGDLPDVIMNFNVPAAQQMIYGQDGVFLELSDLIDKYGTETKKMFEANPLIKQVATASDGKIYSLPYVSDCYHCTVVQKMWIYQPWLDKLGLKMPTTTDEFYNVLKAFKEQDPNGNGKQDEIPFAGSIATPGNNIDSFVMNAFIYDNLTHDNFGLLLQDGKIDAAFNKPEWKEGLTYLHKLYQEGLISPESFTMDNDQLKRIGENPDVPILGVAAAFHMGNFTQFNGESGRWLQYKAVPPLKGPSGLQVASNTPYTAVSGRY
ncbi:extracellular solute-binding protein, partial [Paenibacillus sepulcri]|nr:extracellular solute-binding protein [Paenibacillus sepulcri]